MLRAIEAPQRKLRPAFIFTYNTIDIVTAYIGIQTWLTDCDGEAKDLPGEPGIRMRAQTQIAASLVWPAKRVYLAALEHIRRVRFALAWLLAAPGTNGHLVSVLKGMKAWRRADQGLLTDLADELVVPVDHLASSLVYLRGRALSGVCELYKIETLGGR